LPVQSAAPVQSVEAQAPLTQWRFAPHSVETWQASPIIFGTGGGGSVGPVVQPSGASHRANEVRRSQ
jgi:hypothetical protein